ncbi:MAG: Gfo/Idh/MocA family oxidoreductase [Magnetospirillum sp.]|nr:MAG: Gfo/Idh/MocA family oxidoreductase [Magnetospirillum sp.]
MISVALVGYGYWGPNLARNFSRQPGCHLSAICEHHPKRAAQAERAYPGTRVITDYQDILSDPGIDAVLIATPVASHYDLARRALLAGKDVMIEKPLCHSLAEAEELVELAERQGCILAVDHTFLFTGAVTKLKELMDRKALGELIYVDSVRINLGLFQQDVNVVWDLAPHDLSIITHLTDRDPVSVQAMGMRLGGSPNESTVYLHLDYDNGMIAHCHLSWVSPVKVRQMLFSGDLQMAVYDDSEPSEKIKIYDKGVSLREIDEETRNSIVVDYRMGDMLAPKLAHREALDLEAEHFITCVRDRRQPLSDGHFALRIMRQIDACQRSLAADGQRVRL